MLAWVRIIWGSLFKCRFSGSAHGDSDFISVYILIRNLVLLRDPFEYQWCWQHWHSQIHDAPCSQSPILGVWGIIDRLSMTDSFSRQALCDNKMFPGQGLLSPELYPLFQWRQFQSRVLASLQRESTTFKPLLPSLRGQKTFPQF